MEWRRYIKSYLCVVAILLCTACSTTTKHVKDGPPAPSRDVDVTKIQSPKPRLLPKSRYGNPESYVIDGKRYYVLKSSQGYCETGVASWYGRQFDHRLTSNREVYDMFKMTAASKVLPLPTYVRVKNLKNNREIVVKVNDRGPFEHHRLIDLSYAAAKKLGILKRGTGLVEVTAISPSCPQGDSDTTINLDEQKVHQNWQKIPKPQTKVLYASHKTNRKQQISKDYLQIGVYGMLTHADLMVDKLRKIMEIPCHVYPKRIHSKTLYYVQIGPVSNEKQSEKIILKLAKLKFPKPMPVSKV